MKGLGLVVTCLLLPCVLSADIRSLDLAVADRTALVVWRETDIHFELVDHFGHTQTAPATLAPAVGSDPHVAADGERYLVVWRDGLDLDVVVVVDQDGTSSRRTRRWATSCRLRGTARVTSSRAATSIAGRRADCG